MPLVQRVTCLAAVLLAGCGASQNSPVPDGNGKQESAAGSRSPDSEPPSIDSDPNPREPTETKTLGRPAGTAGGGDSGNSSDPATSALDEVQSGQATDSDAARSPVDGAAPAGRSGAPAARTLARPGPQSWALPRNGLQQLGVAGTTLPEAPELLWKYPTENGVIAAAAIVGNDVYAAALSGKLLCLDRLSGDLIWSYRSIADPDPKTFAPGFKAAPTVTDSVVYVGDEDGVLHAIERAAGQRKWTYAAGSEIAGSVMVVGEHVLLGSHDRFLYCLSRDDGSVIWKFQTDDMINCSPAVEDGFTFVAGCDTQLRVISLERGEQTGLIPLGDGAHLVASPAVLENMLYVGTHDGKVVGVDWKKQEIVWAYRSDGRSQPYHSSPAVAGGLVVIGGRDKRLHAIDRLSGEPRWTFPTRGRIDSSPLIVGDRAFFGSADGNVYAVRLEDGREVWKYNTGSDMTAAPAAGEGVLVIGAESGDGAVYCFGNKNSE